MFPLIPLGIIAVVGSGLAGAFSGTAASLRSDLTDATDPKYRERDAAIANYTQQILSMGWPVNLTDVLIIEVAYAPGDDAESVYLHMMEETPVIMEDMLIDPASLRNFDKVQNWLKEAAEASGATTAAIAAVTGRSLFVDTAKATAQDIKDTTDPTKSPWPWIAAAAIGLYLYKK